MCVFFLFVVFCSTINNFVPFALYMLGAFFLCVYIFVSGCFLFFLFHHTLYMVQISVCVSVCVRLFVFFRVSFFLLPTPDRTRHHSEHLAWPLGVGRSPSAFGHRTAQTPVTEVGALRL